jgi:exonuclease III
MLNLHPIFHTIIAVLFIQFLQKTVHYSTKKYSLKIYTFNHPIMHPNPTIEATNPIHNNHSKISAGDNHRVLTFNLRKGLDPRNNPIGAAQLFEDCVKHKVAIGCFQETHLTEDREWQQQEIEDPAARGVIYGIAGKSENGSKRYGQGFYVSSEWRPHYRGHKYISDRISVIQFTMNNKPDERNSILTIINAYAPHSGITARNPIETQSFYEQLTQTYDRFRTRSAVLIIAGDMNAKLGQRMAHDDPYIIGSYGKGTRNENGTILATFITEKRMLATNTTFKHSIYKRITWSSPIMGQQRYNMIDYILIHQQQRQLLRQSRAYRTFTYDSDHQPVITTLNLEGLYYRRRPKASHIQNLDYKQLTMNLPLREEYQTAVTAKLAEIFSDEYGIITDTAINQYSIDPNILNEIHTAIIKQTAHELLPLPTKRSKNIMHLHDRVTRGLVRKLRRIRNQLTIQEIDDNTTIRLQRQQKILRKRLRKHCKQQRRNRLIQMVTEMEENKGNTKIYANF